MHHLAALGTCECLSVPVHQAKKVTVLGLWVGCQGMGGYKIANSDGMQFLIHNWENT